MATENAIEVRLGKRYHGLLRCESQAVHEAIDNLEPGRCFGDDTLTDTKVLDIACEPMMTGLGSVLLAIGAAMSPTVLSYMSVADGRRLLNKPKQLGQWPRLAI